MWLDEYFYRFDKKDKKMGQNIISSFSWVYYHFYMMTIVCIYIVESQKSRVKELCVYFWLRLDLEDREIPKIESSAEWKGDPMLQQKGPMIGNEGKGER